MRNTTKQKTKQNAELFKGYGAIPYLYESMINALQFPKYWKQKLDMR